MSPLSADDVKKVITNAVGFNRTILNYSLEPFSANKDGILGSHFLLRVVVEHEPDNDGDHEVKTYTFFVKSTPDSDFGLDLMTDLIFEEEVNFYENIQPLMISDYKGEKWSPICYLAENNLLVFEDLRAQGFAMCTEKIMGRNFVKSALATLARFHACTLLAEAKLGKPINVAFPTFFTDKFYRDDTKHGEATKLGFETIVLMADKLNLDSSAVLPDMYDYVKKSVQPLEGELNVICHSDLWNNNFMFNQKIPPGCIIVDYQLLKYATPAADLSMFIYLNTTVEFRKKSETEMVNQYYSAFQETLRESKVKLEIPTFESILKSYQKYRLIGMSLAATYLPGLSLKPEDLVKIVMDPKALERYMLHNRMEIIGPHLDNNLSYAQNMKDMLSEFINEGKRVLNR